MLKAARKAILLQNPVPRLASGSEFSNVSLGEKRERGTCRLGRVDVTRLYPFCQRVCRIENARC
jgi:hypothetical protein